MENPKTLKKEQSKEGVWLTADEGKRNRNVTAENTDKTTFFLKNNKILLNEGIFVYICFFFSD
jgi:urease accessory protein UreE